MFGDYFVGCWYSKNRLLPTSDEIITTNTAVPTPKISDIHGQDPGYLKEVREFVSFISCYNKEGGISRCDTDFPHEKIVRDPCNLYGSGSVSDESHDCISNDVDNDAQCQYRKTNDECNLYTSPSDQASVITPLKKGTEVENLVIVGDNKDWSLVATGGTAIACAELLTENFNVKNEDILILCIIDLTNLGGSELIREKGYLIKTIVDY